MYMSERDCDKERPRAVRKKNKMRPLKSDTERDIYKLCEQEAAINTNSERKKVIERKRERDKDSE